MKTLRRLTAAFALAAFGAVGIVYAAGLFPNFPIVGQGTYSAGSGVMVPAGPGAMTGNETFPADTNLSAGRAPQTVLVPAATLWTASAPLGNFRNRLIGGDYSVNPWVRGTTITISSSSAVTYTADRMFAQNGDVLGGTTVTRQTGATDIVAGEFVASLRIGRTAGTVGTGTVCKGQVITSQNSSIFQGRGFVYSFWALAGANFSATTSNVQVTVASGTGSDQSSTLFTAGTWTGYANAYQANTSISTTWTRYSVSGIIPATATQVGVKLCYTPSAATAGANDWFEVANEQLEAVSLNAAGTAVATTVPSAFERRHASLEQVQAQAYAFALQEGTAGTNLATGQATSTTNCSIPIPFSRTMRAVPTGVVTAGGFRVVLSTGAAATPSTLVLPAQAALNRDAGTVNATVASGAGWLAGGGGSACMLQDGGSTGSLLFTAEL